SPSTAPSDSGAARWQQQSSSAPTSPLALRNSTTLSLRRVLAIGLSVSSWDHSAVYQPLRRNISLTPRCRHSAYRYRIFLARRRQIIQTGRHHFGTLPG